jgi:hypothetical protein
MNKTAIKAALAYALSVTALGANAAVTQLGSPADIATSYLNDFESVVDAGPATFDSTAFRITAAAATDSVTPSGSYGLFHYIDNGPLNVQLSAKYNSVGFYVGNDDFGYAFDAILTVFDGETNLGTVTLAVNRNDYADQFLGLSSSLAFNRVQISYQRPEAHLLAVYIDDFRLGAPTPVPEPGTYALMLMGLAAMGAVARRRTPR